MPQKIKKVHYKDNIYGILIIDYNGFKLPTVIDWDDVFVLKKLNKRWKCHKNGFLSTIHPYKGSDKHLYLHEIIMAQKMKQHGGNYSLKPIIHVNRLGLDNRRKNLEFTGSNHIYRNTKKKKRTIKLPKNSNINIEDIPTYVWYMKPNGTHGERFYIEIGNIKWKTTASKKVSLKDKLEQAKEFLRNLKKEKPNIFKERSMNGEFTENGKKLLDEYYDIIHKGGFTDFKKTDRNNITNKLIDYNE